MYDRERAGALPETADTTSADGIGDALVFTPDPGDAGVDAAELRARLDAADGDDARMRIALAPDVTGHAAELLEGGEELAAEELRRVVKAHGLARPWDAAVKRARAELRAAAKAAAEREARERATREREAREAREAAAREAREARARDLGEELESFTTELELPGGVRVEMEPGRMSAVLPPKADRIPEPLELLNAAARVVAVIEERAAPDAAPVVHWRVAFARRHGAPVAVEIPAREFAGLAWMDATVPGVCVPSPKRDARELAQTALRFTAADATRVRRRAYLGWERAEVGGWMFIHAAGALGADGPVEGVDVRVPDALAPFKLPPPPAGAELRAAALAVLDFAETGGDSGARVILPCLGATIRAGLGPVEKGVTVWLSAPPGVGKSYLASLCARFYGAGFTPDAPAVSFLDKRATDAGVVNVLAAAGDVLVWCDDAKESGVELASRVAHVHFNRAADAKSLRAGGLRATVRPRSTVLLVTAEARARGHSVRQRVIDLEMQGTPARRDAPGLERFDALASAGVFARATSAIVARAAAGDRELARRRDREAAHAWGLEGTGREGELFGPVAAGLEALTTWLRDVLPEERSRVDALAIRGRKALAGVFAEQGAAVAEESPAVRTVRILAAAVSAGAAHVAEIGPQGKRIAPREAPDAWGWRESGDGMRGSGDCIGFLLPNVPGIVAVDTEAALAVAERRAPRAHPLDTDGERFGAALYRAGLLAIVERRDGGARVAYDPAKPLPLATIKTTCRARPGGPQQRLLFLRASALLGCADAGSDREADGGDGP